MPAPVFKYSFASSLFPDALFCSRNDCNKCWSAYMRYIMEIIRDICDNVFGILDTNMDI